VVRPGRVLNRHRVCPVAPRSGLTDFGPGMV
jgi:hypothetical protein